MKHFNELHENIFEVPQESCHKFSNASEDNSGELELAYIHAKNNTAYETY